MAEPPPPGMEAEEPAPPGVAAEAAPAPTADEAAAAAAAYAAAYAGYAGYDPNAAGYYDQQAYWNYYYASQGYGAAAPAAGVLARPAMSNHVHVFLRALTSAVGRFVPQLGAQAGRPRPGLCGKPACGLHLPAALLL
jgi:hypothetical protein